MRCRRWRDGSRAARPVRCRSRSCRPPITGCCLRCCGRSVRAIRRCGCNSRRRRATQIDELSSGRIDAARHSAVRRATRPGCRTCPSCASRWWWRCRPRRAMRRKTVSVRLAEVAALPLVIFPRRLAPGFMTSLRAATARRGNAAHRLEAIQMQTIVSLVSAGMGVALVPQSLRNRGAPAWSTGRLPITRRSSRQASCGAPVT